MIIYFLLYNLKQITLKFTLIQNTNLENEMSLSVVDISGDDSQSPLLPSSDRSGKPPWLGNFSCLAFGADIGVELSLRMFPSEKDLLKNDLKNSFHSYHISCVDRHFQCTSFKLSSYLQQAQMIIKYQILFQIVLSKCLLGPRRMFHRSI